MGQKYRFRRAQKIIATLHVEEMQRLVQICSEIQQAEEALQHRASQFFTKCLSGCAGLCCRNIELDAIIEMEDFVFLLTLDASLKNRIESCLEREEPLFTSDCLFLQNGSGPCIFPGTTRPEVCITTFCERTTPVNAEIRSVKKAFAALHRFLRWRRLRALVSLVMNLRKG